MKWNSFSFGRFQKPARRRPITRAQLAVEELEARLTPSAVNMVTYHNDNTSSGQNLNETVLTPSNVNSTNFGKLFSTSVDGQVYAQPLYVAGLNITTGANQGIHNVVFVATQHDSLYAIDADNGLVLWRDALLHAVHGGTVTSVPNGDVNSSDITPEIGVTATPVIDAGAGLIFVEAKSKEVASDGTHYIHQLYVINVADGSFKTGSPVVIADSIGDTYVSGPTVKGTGAGSSGGTVFFDALRQMERPGLTEANGNIYLAFASHGDNGPYHGWVLSYNASTLTLNGVFNTTPNGSEGGIWQSGGRLAVDASGNLYFETGNGTFDTSQTSSGMPLNGDYGDSFVKIAVDSTTNSSNQNVNGWGLKAVDYFTPFDQQNLNNGDLDLGSGGPMLLPDSVGSTAHPHLMVGAGKEGRIYLIDRDNMGHFSSTTDNIVQETNNTTISGSFDTPAFFNGTIYYVGGSNIGNPNDVGKTFSISNGQISLTPTSKGPDSYAYPGSTPSISANGTSNAVVWDLDTGTNQLRAYSATGYNTELYTSAQAAGSRDVLTGSVVKFSVPTVDNGHVYVGSSNALNVYGLLAQATLAPAAPSNLAATALSGTSVQLTWTDNSTSPNTATGFDIEQSTDGVNFAQVATASAGSTSLTVGGLTVSTTYTFRIRAFDAIGNSGYSNTASATTTNQVPILDFSNGFANASGLLTLNGTAKVNGTALQLTDGGTNEAGTAFSTNKVDVTRFNSQFSFQLTAGTSTADGIAFTIEGLANTALGPTGGGLGYGPDHTGGTGGIASSVAIKFDLYNNQGEGVDSTGLYTNGVAPTNVGSIDLTGTGIDLHSGDKFNVSLAYNGTTLTVTETDASTNKSATQSYTIDIPTTVGGGTAYVGFTGGTGGLTATQDILTWTYSPTATSVPAVPSSLTATAASGTQVNLAWTNNANNQTGFHIDRATNSTFTQNLVTLNASASATTFVDSGLTTGTTYFYEVRATNAAGDSSDSNSASVTTPTLPAAPSNAQVVKVTTGEIDLTWTNNAANATGIEVFRQKGANTFGIIASLPATATSLNDTGLVTALVPGTAYTYHVDATNLAGPSAPAAVSVGTLTLPPASLAATAGNNVVNLSWTAPTGAVSYKIYRGTTAGGEATTPLATGVTTTTYSDATAVNGTTYFYKVTAVNGNAAPLASESAASNEASATPAIVAPPAAPTNLAATNSSPPNTATAQVSLTWTASTGATSYNVYRALTANGEGATPLATGLTSASYTDKGVTFGTTYFYKVTAVNGGGESTQSTEASTTPYFAAHIHWTNDSTEALPSGYISDLGSAYGSRSNGLTYGWNQDNTANMRDRDSTASPDELHDGLGHMQKPNNPNAWWGIAVPNGTYSVHLLSGDPNYIDSVYKINAGGTLSGGTISGGTLVISGTPTSGNHWFANSVSVTVTNGVLYISNATGSSNDKIDAIDITETGTRGYVVAPDYSGGFANTSGLTLDGSTRISGADLRLTDGRNNEAASAFTSNTVRVAKFNTQFSFQLTNPNADGIAFVIQTFGATALGASGGGLGYQGIGSSVAVKFDLYNNNGEGINSTGLFINGAAPFNVGSVNLNGSGIDLHGGHVFNVSMTYDGTTLIVTITDGTTHASATQSYRINIPRTVGGSTAFVGFTGGTGGLTATQDILSWKFTPAW
jgi:fibronectin type 3 domain-containing protein